MSKSGVTNFIQIRSGARECNLPCSPPATLLVSHLRHQCLIEPIVPPQRQYHHIQTVMNSIHASSSSSSPSPDFMTVQSDKFIKLISAVDGRDKLYKTIQYIARTAWWLTNSRNPKHSSLSKLKTLDSTFSEARKTFRLGGFVRDYKELISTKYDMDNFMSVFKYASNMGNVVGEVMDLMLWLAKVKVVNINKDTWDWWRNLLWMVGILYTLTEQFTLLKQTYRVYLQMKSSHDPESRKEVAHIETKLRTFILIFARFISDFFLCGAMLRDYSNKGYSGLFGVVSGAAGLILTWRKL